MRKLMLGGTLAVALAMPAGAVAEEQPSPADFKNASKYCKALKKSAGAENFKAMFGGKKNAHGKCVSKTAKKNAAEDEQQEKEAKQNASKECRTEREADPAAFGEKYGSNKNGKNAFGKCVSQKAKENKAEADAKDKAEDKAKINAAKKCKAARKDDGDAFAEKYGKKRNAFGKCVSQTARGGGETEQQPAQG
jgi:hypothetical protein